MADPIVIPQSHVEEILAAIINGEDYPQPPQSRVEWLLLELKAVIEAGGGGGVTVIANPSGEATANLIKLKVGSTIYAIAGGGSLTEALTASINVGGIKSGKSYTAGTSIETVLQDLLNPVLNPTLTAPSATISATGTKLLESGSTLNTTITVSFNRGSINPAYGTSGYRSGPATGYKLNSGESQAGNTFNVTVTSAQKTYQVNVAYSAGEQPKNSAGENYSTPLAAGSVNSNTITYEFVDALYANTSSIGTETKLDLVSKSDGQIDFDFPAQTPSTPETFDVPASWTVSHVQVFNELSGRYENADEQFDVTNTTHPNAAGVSVNYKRYTCNLDYATGARSVRLLWS